MSHIDDIKNWQSEKLPILSIWNTGGYTFDNHIQKVKDGYRVLPAAKMNVGGTSVAFNENSGNMQYMQNNQLPLCVRTDNISTMLSQLPRQPLVMENLYKSAVVWNLTSSGTLNDDATVDFLCPTSIWADAGAKWGSGIGFQNAQARYPNSPYILFSNNNEGPDDKIGTYFDGYSQNRWDIYVPMIKYFIKPTGILPSKSLKIYDWILQHPTADSGDLVGVINQKYIDNYTAFYNNLNNSLTTWKNKLLKDAYKVSSFTISSGNIELGQYDKQLFFLDGGGHSIYSNEGQWNNFTSINFIDIYNCIPHFKKAETRNPNTFREIFLNITDGAVLYGYKNNIHDIITPDLYQGYIEKTLWSIHDSGISCMIRYWDSSAVKPSDSLWSSGNLAYINSIGRSDLAPLTKDFPVIAAGQAVNKICENQILRKFWKYGTAVVTGIHPAVDRRYFTQSRPSNFPINDDIDTRWRLLECNINTPRSQMLILPAANSRGSYNTNASIKIWAQAIKYENDYLIHLWTPCTLSGNITFTLPNVGDFTVPAPVNSEYYVYHDGIMRTLAEYQDYISIIHTTIGWTPSVTNCIKQTINITGPEINITVDLNPDIKFYSIDLIHNQTYVITITAFTTYGSSSTTKTIVVPDIASQVIPEAPKEIFANFS